ncbi:MAG: D-alanine--D-alanine ligase [Proteobacteria bacterium]|nr:D-alanine--D-alanine ligase [Pseudomonadota bacterium]
MSGATRVVLLAGGRSEEHEVSIVSARCILAATEQGALDVKPLVATREGRWLSEAESRQALQNGRADRGGVDLGQALSRIADADIVLPMIHGPYGEDGTLQGMLEIAGVPYVGSGVLASALCMDKAMSKDLLARHGLPLVPYRLVRRDKFESAPARVVQACASLKPPWFVKPANLGSSLGMSKVHHREGLRAAIAHALTFDRRVVVEQSIERAREFEVALLGNHKPEASAVGEITYGSEYYDYETKYGEGRAELHIPAPIDDSLRTTLQSMAKQAFVLLDCAGLARVDFLYCPERRQAYVSETNTLPGFTPTSMFTRLWDHQGLSYPALIERLVELALERVDPD